MEGFTTICTMIVISMLIMFVTGLISFMKDTDDMSIGWIMSSFGFGICLTIVLLEKGVI